MLTHSRLAHAFFCGVGIGTLVLAHPVKADEALKPDFTFKGDIQMQGEKSWARGWGGNNLDNLWGRINFGAGYKSEDFSSDFNIRIYPEGFGFDPVVSATYDTVGQGSLKLKTSEQARVSITSGWVMQQFPDFAIRLGRFTTRQTPSYIYGDYIDLNPGAAFGSRIATHNATEITASTGGLSSSMIIATSDKHLNKGFLRVYETWTNGAGLTLAGALRTNIFDKVYDVDAELQNRVTVAAHYADAAKWGLFFEAGMIQQDAKDDLIPILAGLYIPAGFVAQKLMVEAEFVPDRTFANGDDRPITVGIYGQKKVFKRVTFDVGIYSDAQGIEFLEMGTSARFTCALK